MSQKVWDRLSSELKAPEEYCVSNADKGKKLKDLIKAIFELASVHPARGNGPLKTLLIDGIDEETLWEQIQTRNNPMLKYLRKYMKSVSKRSLEFLPAEDDSEEEEEDATSEDVSEEEDEEEGEFDDEEMDEDEDQEENSNEEEDDEEMDDDDEEESDDSSDATPEKKVVKTSKKRIHGESAEGWDTDEELAMEAWLDATDELDTKHQEKKEKKERRAKANTMDQDDDDEDDAEDDLDIVERAMYGDDDEEDEDMDPANVRYEDFYSDDRKKNNSKGGDKKRKVVDIDESSGEEEDDDEDEDDFDMDGGDDYQESEEEDDYGRPSAGSKNKVSFNTAKNNAKNNNNNSKNGKPQPAEFSTSYQRRLQELSTQIQELEQELIAEKSWELRGEIAAQNRPENSLLDLAVDVDRATKIAPVITQEYTSTLEDLIKTRIEEGKFDDPKPRSAIAEVLTTEPGDDKDPIELSQEKSKLGLAEIYAEDFAKKMLNSDEKLNVETQSLREEVVGLFGAVSRHLDALCHFYFTPRPVSGETSAKVLATQRAMPALELEDVAPFSVQSDASKLAPEELLAKKKGPRIMLLSSEELGRDDRKKRRRVKKEIKRTEKRHAESQLDANVKRARREEAVLSRDKRVSVHSSSSNGAGANKKKQGETGEFSKSSTFFSNLQKDVEAGVKSNNKNHSSQKKATGGNAVGASASSYKL